MPDSSRYEKLSYVGAITAVVLGLYLSSFYSYLLFHNLIEITTVAIAFTLFILTWNTRRYLKNNYLRLLGIGYAFIAMIDLLHTLAYKGMGVFPGFGANLPTQLWIAARYLQAVTLLAAPLFVERRLNNRTVIGIYAIAVSAFVVMVYTGNFPDCFIEGKGLTAFKIGSEYVISVLLLTSLYLFYGKRKYFHDRVFILTAASIACTVFSEISFTTYVSVYGFANMIGHFAKLAAFYLIYQAILVTGLKEPFDLIFRDLKQAEAALRNSQDTLEEKVRERTAELRTSEERYRSLIQKVQAAIVLHDGQGHILTSNPLAQHLLDLSEDQLLGKSMIDRQWHFLRENGSAMPVSEYPVSRVLSTRQPLRGYTTGISRPDRDDVTWVLVNAEPEFNDAGEIALVIVSFVDITERKQAEEELKRHRDHLEEMVRERTAELTIAKELAEAAANAKSEFLARMSHEIRTPMNAITGLTNLTLDTELTPLQKDYLSKVRDASRHLLRIINDILDFSKIEAGKLELEHVDFMLHHVIEKMANMFRLKSAEKRIELFYIIDSHVPLALKGDPFRLGQVLINLISNAVKFTEKGEIIIKVEPNKQSAEPLPRPDQVDLRFCVQDSGIGIPPDRQAALFEPFAQLDGSMTRKHEGSGLGLSICHRLVNLMGGRIWFESEVGRGSSFYFNLILDRQTAERPYRLVAPADIRGLNVLVVDDNETARLIVEQMLRQFGFHVALSASGQLGLAELERAAAQRPYDLLIVDCKMPEMDGFEMAARIRNHPVLGANTILPKIIMISMYGRDEILQVRNGNADAIDGYLFKPISSSDLFNTIMEAFGKAAAIVPRIPQEQHPLEAIGVEGLGGARILVVEDNFINQQVAVAILQRVGLAVEVAENGQAAMDLLMAVADTAEPIFDAVLMDIEMPVMDGYEATRRIRQWEASRPASPAPHPSSIPIIAMTAHALTGDREACLAVGMDDYIAKPIDERELYAALVKWIKPGQRKVTKPCVPAKMVVAPWEDMPKEIAGIDLETALAHVNADTGLYKKMLLGFLEKFGGAGRLIGQYLHDGKWEAAYQLGHALKGVSGNIGANGIFQSAQVLCKVLKTEKKEQLRPALDSFLQQFSIVSSSLKGLRLEEQPPALSKDQIEAVDPTATATILRDLLELLEKRNSRAMNAFQALKNTLQDPRFYDRLNRLDRAIYNLDYKKSISVVSQLIQELNMPLKNG
jgi:PAS domain S-box-containing protein